MRETPSCDPGRPGADKAIPDATDIPPLYHPYYCEENVWHLCQAPRFEGWDRRVLFISNTAGCCALWNQKAAEQPGQAIVWDYHVVLLACPAEQPGAWQVWDPDSTLGSPRPLCDYLQWTFGLGTFAEQVPEQFRPRFRLLEAEQYLDHFSSDRSHMLDADGEYLKPPPPWDPISRTVPSNLSRFCDLETPFLGQVLGLSELARI